MPEPARKPLIRLPESYLLLPLILSVMGTIISGGVAWSQTGGGANWGAADLAVFAIFAGAFVAVVLVRIFAPIDWISDEEIKKMELDEFMEEYRDESRRKLLMLKLQFGVAFAALVAGFRWVKLLGDDRVIGSKDLAFDAHIPNGGDGAALMGHTFGTLRILGKDWTGVELAIILPLLGILGWTIWNGLAHLIKLNRRSR